MCSDVLDVGIHDSKSRRQPVVTPQAWPHLENTWDAEFGMPFRSMICDLSTYILPCFLGFCKFQPTLIQV